MNAAILEFELLDDLVISARAASVGGHISLDYIPGGTILGAAAALVYGKGPFVGDAAYRVFHSGSWRFGNGFPLDEQGRIGWPVPRAWYHSKGMDPVHERAGDDRQRFLDWVRLVSPNDPRGRPLNRGYVVPETGQWLQPDLNLRMKTAIDPASGRAAQGQLYGYQSLNRGQRFRARIETDDPDADLFDSLCAALTGRSTGHGHCLRLGRSRSAQFGQVRCTLTRVDKEPELGALVGERRLTLWLLADLAAADAEGQPTLSPLPQWLGLPRGRLDPDQSFVTARRYSPYNAFRRAPDQERQVIEQGSVLRFNFDEPLTDDHIRVLSAGLGLHREAGLGRVEANPGLLDGTDPYWPVPDLVTQLQIQEPSHPLVQWLKAQSIDKDQRHHDGKLVKAQLAELAELYDAARNLQGLPRNAPIGPGLAQWGRVLEVAKRHGNDRAAVRRALFEGDDAVCRSTDPDWDQATSLSKEGGKRPCFRSWLEGVVVEKATRGDIGYVLRTLARKAQTLVKEISR